MGSGAMADIGRVDGGSGAVVSNTSSPLPWARTHCHIIMIIAAVATPALSVPATLLSHV